MEKNARFDQQSPTAPERTPPCGAYDRDNEPENGKQAAKQGDCSLMDRLVRQSTKEGR